MARNILTTNTGKTVIWIIGNGFFGLAPLVIMEILRLLAPNTALVAGSEITHLFNDGLVLFIACAMMGSCVIDVLNEGISVKGFEYFALLIFPFAVLFLLFLIYTLIVCKVLDTKFFGTHLKTHIIIIFFTIIYCSLAKYYLYKGGLKND